MSMLPDDFLGYRVLLRLLPQLTGDALQTHAAGDGPEDVEGDGIQRRVLAERPLQVLLLLNGASVVNQVWNHEVLDGEEDEGSDHESLDGFYQSVQSGDGDGDLGADGGEADEGAASGREERPGVATPRGAGALASGGAVGLGGVGGGGRRWVGGASHGGWVEAPGLLARGVVATPVGLRQGGGKKTHYQT